MACQVGLDPGGGGFVFAEEQQVTAAAGTQQLNRAQIVAYAVEDLPHFRRVGAGIQALVQAPTVANGGQEQVIVAFLDGGAGVIGVGPNVGNDPQVRWGVEEEAADDLSEDVFGEARDAGVVEQDGAVGVFVVEEVMRQPADSGFLGEARSGFDQLDAAENGAGLVLPAAAGGEHLFQRQRAREEGVAVPIQAAQIPQRRQDCRRKNAAGADRKSTRLNSSHLG